MYYILIFIFEFIFSDQKKIRLLTTTKSSLCFMDMENSKIFIQNDMSCK